MIPKKAFKKLPPPPTKKPTKPLKRVEVTTKKKPSLPEVPYVEGIPKEPGVYLCRIKRGKDLSDEIRICSNGKLYYIHESASTGTIVGWIGPIERAKGQKRYDK
jgi:hypothetical protein